MTRGTPFAALLLAFVAAFALSTVVRVQAQDMTAAHHGASKSTPCHSDRDACPDDVAAADTCCAKCSPLAPVAPRNDPFAVDAPVLPGLLLSQRGVSHADDPPIPPPRIVFG